MSLDGAPIESPCVKLCRMDRASGLCEGCHRTLDEIAGWGQASDAVKLAILARVAQRREALTLQCNCSDGA